MQEVEAKWIETTLRAYPANGPRTKRVAAAVRGLAANLPEHCHGQLSERFAGDPPFQPAGSPACAAAVGEVLRALRLLEERGL